MSLSFRTMLNTKTHTHEVSFNSSSKSLNSIEMVFLTVESLCFSDRTLEYGSIPHADSELFPCPTVVTWLKTSSSTFFHVLI